SEVQASRMNWSIDFAPILPWPIIAAGAVVALLLVGLLAFRRSRGTVLRALALGALILALTNPTLRQEERENLGNIAIVVMDESTSNALADRPEQAQAIRADLEEKLGQIPGLQVRWVTAARPDGQGSSGTNLFEELNRALANTPPDRLAGVIMVTDGQVHDVPNTAEALGFDAPVHTLLTGQPEEFDRRIEVLVAPKYAIVGQSRDVEIAVREAGQPQGAREPVTLRVRREGRADEIRRATIDQRVRIP